MLETRREVLAYLERRNLPVFPGDAHAFLMAAYMCEKLPFWLRQDAAKAAIGYEKPRLAPVDSKGKAVGPTIVVCSKEDLSI